jgi:serine/threonine protein phosphatase PrpC
LEQWPNIALPKGLICKPQIGQVIADPECIQYALTDEHRWLILATDGLWGDITNQKAIELVQLHYTETNSLAGIAKKLTQYAINKGAEDNITVFVVDLFNLCKKRAIEVS